MALNGTGAVGMPQPVRWNGLVDAGLTGRSEFSSVAFCVPPPPDVQSVGQGRPATPISSYGTSTPTHKGIAHVNIVAIAFMTGVLLTMVSMFRINVRMFQWVEARRPWKDRRR